MQKRYLQLAASAMIAAAWGTAATSQVVPPLEQFDRDSASELQLEVYINDVSTQLIASARRNADGSIAIPVDQLRNVGIVPESAAAGPDGWIIIGQLPGVAYRYDEATQSIRFTVSDEQRVAKVLGPPSVARPNPQDGFGALINYTLFANLQSENFRTLPSYQGGSGFFDSRIFSPYGTVTQSFIGRLTDDADFPGFTRLDTRWVYSDPASMISYSAGDFISGGVSWSRPVRMGGVQIARNFSLRPDLLTIPIPALSGSAAVPSTVDVYINNSKTYSDQVLGGPFQVANLPIVTGPGTARVVVRDALGRETVQDVAFYASPQLLAPGLYDFSGEAGYARTFYGTSSWSYVERPVGSGTVRYGLSDTLTLEAHGEGGEGLANAGMGAVFGLGQFGIGSLSLAGSSAGKDNGFQAGGSVQVEYGGWTFFARTQRTFGTYDDIASITASRTPFVELPYVPIFSSQPPKSLDQVSVSVPLPFDTSAINLSFTQVKNVDGSGSRIVGASYSRQFLGSNTAFITAYRDFENSGSYGIFAGISVPLGNSISASAGAQTSAEGATFTADVIRPQGTRDGDYGWRVRAAEGGLSQHSAALSYRTPVARLEAGAQQTGRQTQATAQAEGAIALMDGEVFFSNRIDDAFAVVDAGAPGVPVMHENRLVGVAGSSGKILVPTLRSWETNEIAIDPTLLPLSADIPKTREKVVPAQSGGVIVRFGATSGERSALVVLSDASGKVIEAGSIGQVEGQTESFIIGYDGQAYLSQLNSVNTVIIDRRDGSACRAEFAFTPNPGQQVIIPNVVCR